MTTTRASLVASASPTLASATATPTTPTTHDVNEDMNEGEPTPNADEAVEGKPTSTLPAKTYAWSQLRRTWARSIRHSRTFSKQLEGMGVSMSPD